MDYGQNTQSDSAPDFFTAGAGTNTFEAENNLDLTNNQADWSSPIERSNRDIGSKAMNTPEMPYNNPDTELASAESNEMGKIVNLEMPPGMEIEQDAMTKSEAKTPKDDRILDISEVRGERDRISNNTLFTVQKTVSNFNRGVIGPEELADMKTEGTEAYLFNTYKRKYGYGRKYGKAA